MNKTSCRLCNSSKLVKWLDLGFHPHSDQFRKDLDMPQETYPLSVMQCQACGFVQLSYVVPPTILYTKDYLYESSITSTGDKHWTDFVEAVVNKTGISSGRVLDIGSNDGTLLLKFKKRGFEIQGVDPCPDITSIAIARGVPTMVDFFGFNAIKNLPKVDIVTASNVFAHIDDLHDVIKNVLYILKKDGVFIFESPYFGELLKGLEYDTIYHQHLSYLSLKPLVPFLAKYNLEIFDVDFSDIHGGSMRVYINHKDCRSVSSTITKFIQAENFSIDRLFEFAKKVIYHRLELTKLITDIKLQNKTIYAVSAPAKGMTLLNYTKIGHFIDCITERSKLKIGRFTPGFHIKIQPDEALIEKQPDYALLLAWNFAPEIIRRNKDYKGKWIVPLPKIQVL